MICKVEDLKKISSILLSAVDSSDISKITDNLELKVENQFLNLSVTNGEYYVCTKLPVNDNIEFHATINASIFLKLLTKITTENVEFRIEDNSLVVSGNGEYKIPLIYDGDSMFTLPEISIDNVTTTFDIDSSTLKSILQYNSKELNKRAVISSPVQTLYYIDEEGAITFTSGACVNVFKLPKQIKILLNQKIVKLFKLFDDCQVKVNLGQDFIDGANTFQTKVSFESDVLKISAIILNNDSMIGTVPVKAIRDRAFTTYENSASFNRVEFLQAIERLLVFYGSASQLFAKFEFSAESVKIQTLSGEVNESIRYTSSSGLTDVYEAILDLENIKTVLSSYNDSQITMNFGDGQAFVIIKPNIYFIIPEARA